MEKGLPSKGLKCRLLTNLMSSGDRRNRDEEMGQGGVRFCHGSQNNSSLRTAVELIKLCDYVLKIHGLPTTPFVKVIPGSILGYWYKVNQSR